MRAQHHACMTATSVSPANHATAYPGDGDVHVWHFAYQREHGHAPLLALLARYLGGMPADFQFVVGAHGRPQLDPALGSQLDFNWSHSGGRAAVAVARHVAPGIDLERLRERHNALPLARRFFHPQEVAALAAQPSAARSAAFLELWTAKEAVLKATGRGIAFGLQRLHVVSGGALRLVWIDGDDAASWQLQSLTLDPQYVAALAWRGGARQVHVRSLASSP